MKLSQLIACSVAIIFLVLKGVVNLNGFAPIDGVWQLSAFESLNRGVYFFNEYTQMTQEHFFIVSYVLAPVLNLFGENPVQVFYFLVYVVNCALLFFYFKPRWVKEWLLYFIVITSVFFNQQRIEDISLLLLLLGFISIDKKPKMLPIVVSFWMLTIPFTHPVSALLITLFSAWILWQQRSRFSGLWPLLFVVIPSLHLLLSNGSIYSDQLLDRLSSDYLGLLLKTAPFLLLILALFIERRMDKKSAAMLLMLTFLAFALGKSYYMGTILATYVYFYRNLPINREHSRVRIFFIWSASLAAFMIFPINKIVQSLENKSTLGQESRVFKKLKTIQYPSGKLFVSPVIAEPFLSNARTRLALYDATNSRWVITDNFISGDILVATSDESLDNLIAKSGKQELQIDTLISGNIGPILLSKGYTDRKNGVNLYLVKF